MALYPPPVETVSHDQPAVMPSRTSSGPLVFSTSRFQKYRQKITELIAVMLSQHCSATSGSCCEPPYIQRSSYIFYHRVSLQISKLVCFGCLPGFLENMEPQFKWIDCAERVIIYVSRRPCSVRLITMDESLPNDLYLVSNNSPNLPNHCFITISIIKSTKRGL